MSIVPTSPRRKPPAAPALPLGRMSAPPRPAKAMLKAAATKPLANIAFLIGAIFLWSTYSRLAEIVSLLIGGRVPVALVLSIVAIFGLFFCAGNFFATVRSSFSRGLLAYTGWLMVTILFSTWRGGSVTVFTNEWLRSLFVFYVMASLILNLNQVKNVFFVISLSILTIALFGLKFGALMEGRFGYMLGTLANANDFAIHILLALPVCVYVVWDSRGSFFRRGTAAGVALWILYSALRTGSRTGLLMLVLMFIGTLLLVSFSTRLKLIVLTVIMLGPLVAIVPSNLRVRYGTLFSDKVSVTEAGYAESATESTQLRTHLFWYTLRLTGEHPIFGVGPGNFAGVSTTESKGADSVFWRQAHNIYGQIAAETGIPGLLIYLALVWAGIRSCWRLRKLCKQKAWLADIGGMATCLLMMQLGYAFSSIFATSTYGFYIPLFLAITWAFERSATAEIASRSAPIAPR